MQRCAPAVLCATVISGCAGVSISPILPDDVDRMHTSSNKMKGYVVYSPMVVFEVAVAEVCIERKGGNCLTSKPGCTLGSPMILPDYRRPFAIDTTSGLGKAGLEIQVADGWRLSSVKDSSDNSAILGFIEKAAGLSDFQPDSASTKPCGRLEPGLYRWTGSASGPLERLKVFGN